MKKQYLSMHFLCKICRLKMLLVELYTAQLISVQLTLNEKANDRYTSCYHALLFGKYDATFYKKTKSRQDRYSHTIFAQYIIKFGI